jgi:hypothetical protein
MQNDPKKDSGLSWSTPASVSTQKPAGAASPLAPASVAPETSASSDTKITHSQAPVYAGLLVGGIIVGVLLATAWSSLGNTSALGSAATSTPVNVATKGTTTTPGTSKGSATTPLEVLDQKAGSEVTISKLNVVRPTWVVVYVSREGKPGNALGARLFFAGDKGGEVALLRATQQGQQYFVGLSVDNGDRVFSLSADKPIADADGGPLWATFSAR